MADKEIAETGAPPVIDAHQHFWRTAAQEQPWRQSSHAALGRDFEAADLEPELRAAGIDATVLIQSVDEPAENERLSRYAELDCVAGVVAWLPIADPVRARNELTRLPADKLSGIRCLVGRDPLAWLTTSESIGLFREIADHDVAWDVVPVTRQQTEAVIELAGRVPDLRVVVDHLGRPPLEDAGWEPWAGNLRRLADCPNVAIKVSVGIDALTAWPRWDPAVLQPYLAEVSERFGPHRMMLASNWPVITLRASYQQAWADLRGQVFAQYEASTDRSAVLGGTARRWYRLSAAQVRTEGVVVGSDHS